MTILEILSISSIPAILSFILSIMTNRLEIKRYKRENMVVYAVQKLLKHKTFTRRSFNAIQSAIGGYDDTPDELRRILVEAGAIRTGSGDKEMWYLLSREQEWIEKKKAKKKK